MTKRTTSTIRIEVKNSVFTEELDRKTETSKRVIIEEDDHTRNF